MRGWLALIWKIEAADAAQLDSLRHSAAKESDIRAKMLEKKRANPRVARAVQKTQLNERRARSGMRKKPKG